ncbi:MAG: hypothetical protein M1837_000446 [Sclerophora amabilis]|nr:MAG: hypothetical protein M1837_000446 [Sclerophora amabilis]
MPDSGRLFPILNTGEGQYEKIPMARAAKYDRIAQPRGYDMEASNVEAEFFPESNRIPAQDFEFNSAPVIELADTKTTRKIFDLRIECGDNHEELDKRLEPRADAGLQKA